MTQSPIVQLDRVFKHYRMGQQELVAVRNVTLQFQRGEFSGFVGPSGSGKTTVLNLIGTLDTPT